MQCKLLKNKSNLLRILILVLTISFIGGSIYLFQREKNKPSQELNQKTTLEEREENTEVAKEEHGDFVLKIESLDIEALVIRGVDPTNEEEYLKSLLQGVLHMSNTALPGEKGNVFIYGHSSNTNPNKYGRIFTDTHKLKNGDIIDIYFEGEYYKYSVYGQKIVEPTDLSVLDQPKDKEILSLMSCWPINTDEKRLIILAERVR